MHRCVYVYVYVYVSVCVCVCVCVITKRFSMRVLNNLNLENYFVMYNNAWYISYKVYIINEHHYVLLIISSLLNF